MLDIDNGARFETYAIVGGPGEVCLNGAAARLVHRGDKVIVITYADYESAELVGFEPTVVHVDADQRRGGPHRWRGSTTRCARPSRAEAGARPRARGRRPRGARRPRPRLAAWPACRPWSAWPTPPGSGSGVLTKAELAQSTTRWAQGGVAAVVGGDEDSTDLHLADTLAAGAGLCDVDAVRVLVDEGPRPCRRADRPRCGVRPRGRRRPRPGPRRRPLHRPRPARRRRGHRGRGRAGARLGRARTARPRCSSSGSPSTSSSRAAGASGSRALDPDGARPRGPGHARWCWPPAAPASSTR